MQLSSLASRLDRFTDALSEARRDQAIHASTRSTGVEPLIARDLGRAGQLPVLVDILRAKLARAANTRAHEALTALRARLSAWLRRARIGRIDAVMGSKRRIEIQIESLAAGRFPPELRDPLMIQGLLSDDEEYWPFEGEDWPDEYEERYGTAAIGSGANE